MQKRYIPIALFFAALLVFLAGYGAKLLETAPAFAFAEEEKTVYLTFDDGPSTVVTNRILDTLKKEGVKATFFIVSARTAGREETLRRIAREGHTLGVHSATHIYDKIYASDEALLDDAETCRAEIERLTGVSPAVYRFPGGGTGAARARQKKLLEERGFRVVLWNAVCGDEEIPHASCETLVQTAMQTSEGKNNVVLLLHDSARHAATADALPGIIGYYRQNGYSFRSF